MVADNISFKNKIRYNPCKHLNKKILKKGIIKDQTIQTAIKIGNKIGIAGNLSIPYEKPKFTCKYVVSNIGCGLSGSGTIIDFLREFDNCSVYGFLVKIEFKMKKK